MHALSKDVPAREIMAELFGKKTGICRGQGGSMHMFSAKYGLVSCAYCMLPVLAASQCLVLDSLGAAPHSPASYFCTVSVSRRLSDERVQEHLPRARRDGPWAIIHTHRQAL